MSSAEFRRAGHAMIDWIARYLDTVESRPVLAQTAPGELFNALPRAAPETGEPWDAIAADIDRLILPAVTHWQSPHHFAYFPCNNSEPAILGELLSAGLGINGFLWQCSPAVTELEMRVMDWLGKAIALPDEFLFGDTNSDAASAPGGGVIHGTASEATLTAMIAARERLLTSLPPLGGMGLRPVPTTSATSFSMPALVAYASTQAHSSVIKAAMIAGIGRHNVRLIDVDHTLALRPDALESQIEHDKGAGLSPFFVAATVGATSTGAIDPLGEIARVIRERAPRMWLHIDAAYAGAACICPENRPIIAGVEHADSFGFNPHKWLLTNFDCAAFWTRDRRALIHALSITPEYLRNKASSSGETIEYRDWQVPLGRRFRALKLWFVMRSYGLEGLRAHIREHIRLAELFESLVRSDDRFDVVAPRCLSLVCFRLKGTDEANRRLLESLNSSGRLLLTHSVTPTGPGGAAQYILRMAIGASRTQEVHVRAAWETIRALAEQTPA